MRKKIIALLCGITFTTCLWAQKPERIKVPRPHSSIYIITNDLNDVNFEIAEKIALTFGMKKYLESNYSKSFKANTSLLGMYTTAFVVRPLKPAIESYIKFYNDRVDLNINEQIYVYGFASATGDGGKIDRNYSRMMMSAYRQEMDSEYRSDPDNFTTLAKIDKAEYWKRNWINMGYGMSYISKDNPFFGARGLSVGFFYVWEALHYIPILGGAFFGRTQEDKITIPLLGLASLIAWKGMTGILSNRYLKMNKRIIDSGYKIPNDFE